MPFSEADVALPAERVRRRCICRHCGLAVVNPRADDDLYCCFGCRLASRIVGAGDEKGYESWQYLRLGIGGLLALNVMMIAMLFYSGGVESSAFRSFRLIMLALSIPALAILFPPFIGRRSGSLHFLIAAGSFSAFVLSAVNTLRGEGEVYFDTAVMLPFLVLVGRTLEAAAKSRAARLVTGLSSLLPSTAFRLGETGGREVAVELLREGDVVRVRPGERAPVDGTIIEGTAMVEESSFTGEWLPRRKGPGEPIFAGTVNGPNPLLVRAERVGDATLIARIVAETEEARLVPSQLERLSERAAALFTPFVLTAAAAIGIYCGLCEDFRSGGLTFLAMLVVACPCALGIATPLATSLAMARAAAEGVLVRGGEALEQVGTISTLFFDKTGTLTEGRPAVVAVESFAGGEDDLLALLAGLETGSGHPFARGVLEEAGRRRIRPAAIDRLEAVAGDGMRGRGMWQGKAGEVRAGTAAFASAGSPCPSAPVPEGLAAVWVGWDDLLLGRVLLSDVLRPDAAEAVQRLAGLGVRTALLSGDRPEAAAEAARRAGIVVVEGGCGAGEKMAALRSAAAGGRGVGMVGDGVNDAPALAAATVGIALGCGADLAREAGKVVLTGNLLSRIPWLIELSRASRRIIRQNLAWAFGYNALALGAAAAGKLHPLAAALAMTLSSLTLLANSLRLRHFPTPEQKREK